MSKVMEGIVNTQLVNYLEKHEVLPNSQFGFRRGRGTADILTLCMLSPFSPIHWPYSALTLLVEYALTAPNEIYSDFTQP